MTLSSATVESLEGVGLDAAGRFDALYHRHVHDVHRYVRRRIRDPQLAEDVVQETFVRVYRFLDRLDPDRPAWPWIKAIARTMATNAVRGRRHHAELLLDDLPATEGEHRQLRSFGDPEGHVLHLERRHHVEAILSALPARHRAVLVLKEVDDLSCAEIAAHEGSSVETVKAVLARARASFRRTEGERAVDGGSVLGAGVLMRLRLRRVRSTGAVHAMGPEVGRLLGIPATVAAAAVGVVALVVAPSASSSSQPGRTTTTTTAAPVADSSEAEAEGSVASPRSAPVEPGAMAPPSVVPATRTPLVAAGPAAADIDAGGGSDDSLTLDAALWAALGAEEPEAGFAGDLDCDGTLRRAACEAVMPVLED